MYHYCNIALSLLAKDIQNLDEMNDVFAYGMSNPTKKLKKKVINPNDRIYTYIKCLNNKTKDDRNRYCKDTYKDNPMMRISCEVNRY